MSRKKALVPSNHSHKTKPTSVASPTFPLSCLENLKIRAKGNSRDPRLSAMTSDKEKEGEGGIVIT